MRNLRQVLFWLGLALALFVPGCLIYQQEARGHSPIFDAEQTNRSNEVTCASRRLKSDAARISKGPQESG